METIGDAYCVAAGLHRQNLNHAKPIALMALKMMELSEEVLTPDGKPIKVNFLAPDSQQASRLEKVSPSNTLVRFFLKKIPVVGRRRGRGKSHFLY